MHRTARSSADSFADFRFSEQVLAELLDALRARAASHPDNPGIIASWPGVQQHSMAAACSELQRRGYPVQAVSVAGWAMAGPPRVRRRSAARGSGRRAVP